MKKALGYLILALPLLVIVVLMINLGWRASLIIIGFGLAAVVLVLGCICLGHYLIKGSWTPGEKEEEKK